MTTHLERSQTLDELDPPAWGKPTYSSHLVKECHRLRKIALHEMTTADIRLLIGQEIGVQWLLPMAIDALEQNVFVETEYYPGDLFVQVLRLSQDTWQNAPEQKLRVDALIAANSDYPTDIQEDIDTYRQTKK